MINSAYAEAGAAAAGQPGILPQVLLMGGMLVFFYFLLWRPQSKQRKSHNALMESLNKGDEVIMSGGMLGKIQKVDDLYAVLEIASNVSIKVQKNNIISALPKGTLKEI